MAVPAEWIEHRRGGHDHECLGWMRPAGAEKDDGFVVIDLRGREFGGVVYWLEAEETLDASGTGYLADPCELLLEDGLREGGDRTTRPGHGGLGPSWTHREASSACSRV